jgi:L-threonylcarbamoyladenylate synthase
MREVTDLLYIEGDAPDRDLIARAAECLRGGGLVAFPTETVYGLGVHAMDREAVKRLFAAKGRPANDPLIVHVTSIDAAAPLVRTIPESARQLAQRFWPGPLTLVMRRSAAVPDEVTAGLDTVAIRVPAHPIARALIEAAGIPVAAPSANLFSRPSPTRAEHVLTDLEGRIDMVIDGGPTHVGVESTVVDLTGDTPTILRPGAVTLEMLREILPNVRYPTRESRSDDQAMPAPGMMSRHYAPRAPLTLYRGDRSRAASLLEADARAAAGAGQKVGILDGDDTTAARLYAALRELDERGVDVILACDLPDDTGISRAVRDRLLRAAAHIVDVP